MSDKDIKTRLAEIKRYFELQDIHLLKSPHAITQEVHKEYLKLRDKYQGEDLKSWLIDQLEQALAREEKLMWTLKKVNSIGLCHYEDCPVNEAHDDEDIECECGIEDVNRLIFLALQSSAQGKGE